MRICVCLLEKELFFLNTLLKEAASFRPWTTSAQPVFCSAGPLLLLHRCCPQHGCDRIVHASGCSAPILLLGLLHGNGSGGHQSLHEAGSGPRVKNITLHFENSYNLLG